MIGIFLGALLRRIAKTDDAFVQSAVAAAAEELRQQMKAEAEKEALRRMDDLRREAEQWIKLRDLLKQKPDDFVFAEDVVDALRVVLRSGVAGTYGGLRSLVDTVDRCQKDLARVAELLPGLDKPRKRRAA